MSKTIRSTGSVPFTRDEAPLDLRRLEIACMAHAATCSKGCAGSEGDAGIKFAGERACAEGFHLAAHLLEALRKHGLVLDS